MKQMEAQVYCDFEANQQRIMKLSLESVGDVLILNSNFKFKDDKRAFKRLTDK